MAHRLRQAAVRLQDLSSDSTFGDRFAPHRAGLGYVPPGADGSLRSAWALIGEWLTCAAVGASSADEGIVAAHEWFWTGGSVTALNETEVDLRPAMGSLDSEAIHALMPYLLDPMAAATRRDALRDADVLPERHRRKRRGVYYTPGDVAYFMVKEILDLDDSSRQCWVDPACGSGVFLRAALLASAECGHSTPTLLGVDIDPFAAEAASFVLTAADLRVHPSGDPPWVRWHRFRKNLATGDALMIATARPEAPHSQEGLPVGTARVPQPEAGPLGVHGPWRLDDVFPEALASGVERIIANPPYAPLSASAPRHHVATLRPVTGTKGARDVSSMFVELSLQLLSSSGRMAVVLPLAPVASTQSPYPELRESLTATGGRLQMLSFDRAPDALFGDDIKTRNAIVLLDRSAPRDVVATPLTRWTSHSRNAALGSLMRVSVADMPTVPSLIPKIGSDWEQRLFADCITSQGGLGKVLAARFTAPLAEVAMETAELAIAPTAYNFLNVMREPSRAVADGHDSANPFLILRFTTDTEAAAAYALMSSRLAMWLWHVTGDGFHVTQRLTSLLPWPNNAASTAALAEIGDRLWKAASQQPVISRNGGRTTVAYPTWPEAALLDEIDIECRGLLPALDTGHLSRWHGALMAVDRPRTRTSQNRERAQ
ncbi:N-6 DNA methylase [Blastococcus sp. KM273129]|uniref:N-6 DNA methylase n=1 Tax=Blastococcus sp. KM273129 TaxID=2570315 RepID=UPI001F018569|nr:N-6 DNA methylase [Blastococcus sp. KM273129]MCF6735233.1 hypothetical protein [Blastococcus sp. KM273129]